MHYSFIMLNSKYTLTMKKDISPEVAQALIRGERDYAETLHNMGLVRAENNIIHIDNITENLKQGYANLERRLRGTH